MGYIKKEFIERLLDKVAIEDVIRDFVDLKKAGVNLKGLSPFVDERSPSFVVSPVKQIWKDFSSGKGGNVMNFLIEKNMSYPEAVEHLAKKYNETVEYENSEFAARKAEIIKEKEALRPVLKAAHEQYKKQYDALPENHPARLEVEGKRLYSKETIIDWGIGFAPENFLYDKLRSSNRVKQGEDLGLIKEQYDMYSNRVIYAINDPNGLLIGLAGRTVSGKKTSKWINPVVSDENKLYNKSKVWFGIDKARLAIRKKDEAWIVEGYNDVIAWHLNGMENTVAPCGTAIANEQRRELKKLCSKVVFCMDPDAAGIRSMLKYLPEFIGDGFRADIVLLPCDPDDFSRTYRDSIDKYGPLSKMLQEKGVRRDGFSFLMEHHLQGDELDISRGAKHLCELIAKVTDDTIVEIYSAWLSKESKIKATTVKNWIKDFRTNAIEVIQHDAYLQQIELPPSVNIPLGKLEADIRQYGMFMANNQIWMSIGDSSDNRIRFASKSNFEIQILQHMQDEKFPMKLLRIKNIHGLEKIFDTKSEDLNSPQLFDNAMTGHGNFRFDGDRRDLLRLRTYLFDKMGNGRKIDVLGWQPDGRFWVWNNRVTADTGAEVKIDQHGIFIKDEVHYYVPSANVIYQNNSFKYDAQKRFRCINNDVSFSVFAMKVMEVHRDHGISALLFGIASLFQDIVVEKMGSFPLLFLFGPGSSGKDELAAIVQSFTGIPQTAINLEGQVSTIKAQVREFAQFRNGISQLSEFKRGNAQLDGMLKALWDRRGYKRGNIESHVGTDSVPIESSAIITGNDYPTEEPLIIRCIWNEMTKAEFNQSEMKAFDELKDMRVKGVSGYSNDLLLHRLMVEEKFEKEQRSWKGILQELFPEAKSRIITNLSVMCTFYALFKDAGVLKFPFTQDDMLAHFRKGVEQQIRKINSGSILNRFWDLFISSLRGHKDDRIQVNHIVNIEQDLLYFNWTHVFAKIQRAWYIQYREAPPSGSTVLDQIEKSGSFVEKLSKHSFDKGREANRTSAIVINMKALSETVKDDIIGSVMFQLNQVEKETGQESFPFDSPATPGENKILRDEGENHFL